MTMRQEQRRRGFTLIEVMVVVAMIAILAALAVSSMMRSRPEDRLNDASRDMVSRLIKARGMAVTRSTGDPTFDVVDFVEVVFDTGANTYSVVGIASGPPLSTKVLKVYDLDQYSGATLAMAVAPLTVRFEHNGAANNALTITMGEATVTRTNTIEITRAGLIRMAQ